MVLYGENEFEIIQERLEALVFHQVPHILIMVYDKEAESMI